MKDHFKKYWGAWLLGVIVLIVLYAVYRWRQTNNPEIGGAGADPIDPDFRMMEGQPKNETARAYQKRINQLESERNYGFVPLAEDGIFGPITAEATEFIFNRRDVTLNEFDQWKASGVIPANAGAVGS